MSDGYEIAVIDELQVAGLPQFPAWAGIRRHFGIESFGVNAWLAKEAGEAVIVEHDEASGTDPGRHQELYVVLSGRATFTVDGETVDAPEGTLVFVRDPEAKRKAVADEQGTTILAVGAQQGVAFTPSRWERSAPAFGFFATKEYDKARDLLAQAHAENPEDGVVLYNLACAESMAGLPDEAISHLKQSVELEERFRELARDDSDFESIRDRPEFQAVVA